MAPREVAWEAAQREAIQRAEVAFPFPHRVRFVGLRIEPWSRAKRPRIDTRRYRMRLPSGRPYADEDGRLVGQVAMFLVEPRDPVDNTMPPR